MTRSRHISLALQDKKNTKIKQKVSEKFEIIRSRASFVSLTKKSDHKILNLQMQEVNKRIFVQDFKGAMIILSRLSAMFPANYEVQFRRIEVACRTGELQEIWQEYLQRALHCPQVTSLQLAANLAEIRHLEIQEELPNRNNDLINPSLNGANYQFTSKDVTGLSLAVERYKSGLTALPPATGDFGYTRSMLTRSYFRVHRNPSVADDLALSDPPTLPSAATDEKSQNHKQEKQKQDNHLLARSLEICGKKPDNYACWYVVGCAYEYSGDLAEAIAAWKKALSYKPTSIAVLATLSELQQIGVIPENEQDYCEKFEALDPYLVHGSLNTHLALYKEFLGRKNYELAIGSLKTLSEWTARSKGQTTTETEVLCLLGSMKAYKLWGNLSAAESCRKEAEITVISCKKSGENSETIYNLGLLAEEYELFPLARTCYFSVLTSPETNLKLACTAAAHCVSAFPSFSLKEVLQTTYLLHQGHSEIRFCQLLCNLHLQNVPIKRYIERKQLARKALLQQDIVQAIALLQICLRETDEDAETHMMIGDAYWKTGSKEQATVHYAKMYSLDSMNPEVAMKFVSHLIRLGELPKALLVATQALELKHVTQAQAAELHWVRATGLKSTGHELEAHREMQKAISYDPWTLNTLLLTLRLDDPQEKALLPHQAVIAQLETLAESEDTQLSAEVREKALARASAALTHGFIDYAWALAKLLFLYSASEDNITELYAKVGASRNSREAAQQTLMLLQNNNYQKSLGLISTTIATIYIHSGEWALFEEWRDIAKASNIDESFMRSKLFSQEALALVIQGKDIARALTLLEGAIDYFDNGGHTRDEHLLLLGYLGVLQGELKDGVEKMKRHLGEKPGIISLALIIKALRRSGPAFGSCTNYLAQLFAQSPQTPLERKMLDEVHGFANNQGERITAFVTC